MERAADRRRDGEGAARGAARRAARRTRHPDHADRPGRHGGRRGRGRHRPGVRARAAPDARTAQPLVHDPAPAGPLTGFEPGWTDRAPSGTLAGRMYASAAIATQPNAAAEERGVVVHALSGDGMTFDLPRGS